MNLSHPGLVEGDGPLSVLFLPSPAKIPGNFSGVVEGYKENL